MSADKMTVNKITVDKMTVDNMTVDKMTVDKMTVDKMTVDKMTVDKMTVDKMTVNKMTVDKMTVDKMTLDKMTYCHFGNKVSLISLTKENIDVQVICVGTGGEGVRSTSSTRCHHESLVLDLANRRRLADDVKHPNLNLAPTLLAWEKK
jgi:hypothetical protein